MRVANSIAELRQQIHDDLRIQHPEWIEANGDCPECDFYETRLMEELDTLKGSDEFWETQPAGWKFPSTPPRTFTDPSPRGTGRL